MDKKNRKAEGAAVARDVAEFIEGLAHIAKQPLAPLLIALLRQTMTSKEKIVPNRRCPPDRNTYRVKSTYCELPQGTVCTVSPAIISAGDLVLFAIGDYLTIGRWVPGVQGCDWIVQPGLLIRITGKIPVRIVGAVVPC